MKPALTIELARVPAWSRALCLLLLCGHALARTDAAPQPEGPWVLDGRCVASLCVGDTLAMAQLTFAPPWTLKGTPQGADLLWQGKRWLRLEVEEAARARAGVAAPASRIAWLHVLRPGSTTAQPGPVVGMLLAGQHAHASQPGKPAGQWLPRTETWQGQRVRWWSQMVQPSAAQPAYPVNFAVDNQQRVIGATLNGGNQLEAAYSGLGAALAASQARLKTLAPKLAWLPQQGPALHRAGYVYADLTVSADAATLRLSSRPDCAAASCEIASIDIGRQADNNAPQPPEPTEGLQDVKLADGSLARFQPLRCGASCTPPALWLQRAGVPVRISFETAFVTPPGQPLTEPERNARDLQLLRELAASMPAN